MLQGMRIKYHSKEQTGDPPSAIAEGLNNSDVSSSKGTLNTQES